jgi:hypothetical protein
MRVSLASGLMLIGAIDPALSDWEYTKWGMTPEQVTAASNAILKPCVAAACQGQSTDSAQARLYGPYRSGDFAFTAFALFDRMNRLTQIELLLNDGSKGSELIGALRARYGEPVSEHNSSFMAFWVWRPGADEVTVMTIGQAVTLRYQPRTTESRKGL